jgi:hypothetical protein
MSSGVGTLWRRRRLEQLSWSAVIPIACAAMLLHTNQQMVQESEKGLRIPRASIHRVEADGVKMFFREAMQ